MRTYFYIRQFRLGSIVVARLGSAQDTILRLPESAVLKKNDQTFVWTVDPLASTVSLHKVDLSGDEAGMRVTGGLAAGTRIVTAGIHSLTEGQHVRIEQDTQP